MSVPFLLPYGFVAVYGIGTDVGQTGLATTNTLNRFATIYYIGVGMNSGLIGSSILFKSSDEVCQLSWDSYPYPVIPSDKIIGTEDFL